MGYRLAATRWAPLIVVAVIGGLLRLLLSHPAGGAPHGIGRVLLSVAIASWTLALLALWHARATQAPPAHAAGGRRPADAGALAMALKAKIVGRDALCDELAALTHRRIALQVRSGPVGVVVFAGEAGVGKARVAKALAGALGRPLVRLDMGGRRLAGDVQAGLFGRARGLTGSARQGTVTAALRQTPQAILLLEDFEQAHPDVQKAFLAGWIDGAVVDAANGQAVPTTQAIFLLSTTLRIESPGDFAEHAPGAGFAPELLPRIDRVFPFQPLAGDELARASERESPRARAAARAPASDANAESNAGAVGRAAPWRRVAAVAAGVTVAALVARVVDVREAFEHAGTVSSAGLAPSPPRSGDRIDIDKALPAERPPASAAGPAPSYAEELRNLAQCHPGLAHAPAVPSFAAAGVVQPDTALYKVRFWVNGGGKVVRDEPVGGQLGTPAERAAAQRYLYGQRYNIPDVGDCGSRSEIELIANFFLARNGVGSWQTLVAVHPRWWFDDSGQLRESN